MPMGRSNCPGDADYVTLPNYRSDGSEVQAGRPGLLFWWAAGGSFISGKLRQCVVAGQVPPTQWMAPT